MLKPPGQPHTRLCPCLISHACLQVKAWDREKLHGFWQKWYFPANGTLYIVGDISTPAALSTTVKLIQTHFGSVDAGKQADGSPKARNLGLPPVRHAFGIGELPEGAFLPLVAGPRMAWGCRRWHAARALVHDRHGHFDRASVLYSCWISLEWSLCGTMCVMH